MRRDCTQMFGQYREVARLIWNLGFWPNSDLRRIECVLAYEEAMARLFEGMVLLPLGYDARIKKVPSGLGEEADFRVTANAPGTELQVDEHRPDESVHVWGAPTVRLDMERYSLKFMAFFDWDQLMPRDYRMIEVLIEDLDGRPELVGRHALAEFDRCSIWLGNDEEQDGD